MHDLMLLSAAVLISVACAAVMGYAIQRAAHEGPWRYAATPVGFYVGCLTAGSWFAAPDARKLDNVSPVLQGAAWLALLFVVFAAWRVVPPLWSAWFGTRRDPAQARARRLAAHVWTPHAATSVIGVTFVVILVLVGVWAYTDVLSQLARGSSMRLALGVACLLALYAGALLGGWTAGRWKGTSVTFGGVLRCFIGGVMMAWGSLLIPGSNDGLILIGMPLLRPYAWLAFATMCVSIAAAMLVSQRVAGPKNAQAMP
jgi:toxin CptA